MLFSYIVFIKIYPQPYNKIGDGPEGPEVRTIAENLNRRFRGFTILQVKYNDKSSLNKNKSYKNNTSPLTITGITCKGKHIIFMCLDKRGKKVYIHNHLGMTGYWTTQKADHSHIQFVVIKDTNKLNLWFDDTRRFGSLTFCYSTAELLTKLKVVGIDLLDTAIEYFRSKNVKKTKQVQKEWINHINLLTTRSRSRDRAVFTVLMDQKYFSGIGSYLASEILYKSKINPARKVIDLTDSDIINLFNNSLIIMYASYTDKGYSFKDYRDVEGNKGKFKRLVYGHHTDPHGYPVIKSKFNNGRTCQWVSEVQK